MVSILPVALLSLFFASRRGAGWRDAATRALVLFGVLVAAITEGLGALNALRPWPLFVAWTLVSIGAFAIRPRVLVAKLPRPGIMEALGIAGIVAIAAILLATALLSPPNSADAMAYHMPRVVYWAQAGSVRFFPTVYYNQIMLQPLAEYGMLQTYVLSGGDHFVNLGEWLGFIGSVLGASLIAAGFGAMRRGQVMAALFAVTLPGGILQASGAKTETVLALWLVASAYFTLRHLEAGERADLAGAGLAFGLALFTKGTAYLYGPAIIAGVAAPYLSRHRGRILQLAAACVLGAMALNGPLYFRNLELSGSPLGFDSAQGDGKYRWCNERFGFGVTASNALRHLSEQIGGPSPRWNRGVYRTVFRLHRALGLDANDRATTFRGMEYTPPRNANHEANAQNRWHLLLLALALVPACWKRRDLVCYALGIAMAFLLFCAYLKWQWYLSRMFVPLFVLAAPLAGIALERLRLVWVQAIVCLFLLNNSRPLLLENWTRPLKGAHSMLRTRRDDAYFNDMTPWKNQDSFERAVDVIAASGCHRIGIDIGQFQLEYPFQALLRQRDPKAFFEHTGVGNASSRYAVGGAAPCAVLCMDCAGMEAKLERYQMYGAPVIAGKFLVFTMPYSNRDVHGPALQRTKGD